MTKQLSPLEALNKIAYSYGYDENIKIIEDALKDYERLLRLRKIAKWADEKLQTKKKIQALGIIKKFVDFSLEFDESQSEWFLYISNEEQRVLVAKGTGVKTYDLLKEVLL